MDRSPYRLRVTIRTHRWPETATPAPSPRAPPPARVPQEHRLESAHLRATKPRARAPARCAPCAPCSLRFVPKLRKQIRCNARAILTRRAHIIDRRYLLHQFHARRADRAAGREHGGGVLRKDNSGPHGTKSDSHFRAADRGDHHLGNGLRPPGAHLAPPLPAIDGWKLYCDYQFIRLPDAGAITGVERL